MRTCVTGGAGFIGSHLVDQLIDAGHDVVVLDDFSTGREENLESARGKHRLAVGDVRDPVAVADAVAGCEVIYHQAALASVARSLQHPLDVSGVNIGGTLNILLRARDAGVRRLVFASSSSVYGDTPILPKHEDMPLQPRSPYAATKCAGEAFLEACRATYGLETVALRYFNVYGPRQRPDSQYAAAIPLFIESMLAGRSPVIHGDGEQTRDFTYVEDVVRAVAQAGFAPHPPESPCNLGSGQGRTSINRLTGLIAEAVGYEGPVEHGPARNGDVRDSLADVGAISEWLGWSAEVDLAEGIRRTVAMRRTVV